MKQVVWPFFALVCRGVGCPISQAALTASQALALKSNCRECVLDISWADALRHSLGHMKHDSLELQERMKAQEACIMGAVI